MECWKIYITEFAWSGGDGCLGRHTFLPGMFNLHSKMLFVTLCNLVRFHGLWSQFLALKFPFYLFIYFCLYSQLIVMLYMPCFLLLYFIIEPAYPAKRYMRGGTCVFTANLIPFSMKFLKTCRVFFSSLYDYRRHK